MRSIIFLFAAVLCMTLAIVGCRDTKKAKANARKESPAPSALDVVHAAYPNAAILGNGDRYSFIVIDGDKVLSVETTCDCGGRNPRITSKDPFPVYYKATQQDSLK